MENLNLSLSWHLYQKNLSGGLSLLQQRGEYVDMTIAADGHLVKVHRVVMCLASPFIKELISSAECPHPVIFLNTISYPTLCAILEYAYTGETQCSREMFPSFVQAAKALHIRGLEDLNLHNYEESVTELTNEIDNDAPQKREHKTEEKKSIISYTSQNTREIPENAKSDTEIDMDVGYEVNDNNDITDQEVRSLKLVEGPSISGPSKAVTKALPNPGLQFTVSSHGAVQVILNRYVYFCIYATKKVAHRVWRCVDYRRKKGDKREACRAYVILNRENDQVLKRGFAHNHSFHDKKILSKIKKGCVYSSVNDVSENKSLCRSLS